MRIESIAQETNPMRWISEHKTIWRVAVLMLLVVAVIGPWTYTADGVPPPEWCDEPNILLESGRCVRLVSGASVLTFMINVFPEMSADLVTGETTSAGRGREFFFSFLLTLGSILVVLPFFSTLLLILGRDRRRLRVFQVAAWGVAELLALLVAMLGLSELRFVVWGIWLYVAMADVALTLELLTLLGEQARLRGSPAAARTPQPG